MAPRVDIEAVCDCPCEQCNLLHYLCKCHIMEQQIAIREMIENEELDGQDAQHLQQPKLNSKQGKTSERKLWKKLCNLLINLFLVLICLFMILATGLAIHYEYVYKNNISFAFIVAEIFLIILLPLEIIILFVDLCDNREKVEESQI